MDKGIPAAVKRAHLELAAEPPSAGQARRFVADMLALWDCDDPDQLAELLTSEIVTNAVRYAHKDTQVEIAAQCHPPMLASIRSLCLSQVSGRRKAGSPVGSPIGAAVTEAARSAS